MSNHWRRVAAALSDPDRREAYARAVLGQPGPEGRRAAKSLAELRSAGLVDDSGTATDVFAELLAAQPAEKKHGVDRFMRDGRIDQFPAKRSDRRELLGWVAAKSVGEAETLSEAQVNERLAVLTDDVATLRRYLVDAELLLRDNDGSEYRLG